MQTPILTQLAIALALFCALTCLSYTGLQFRFLLHCRRLLRKNDESPYLPKVGVILCLRGSDETLHAGLESLLNQDYPMYTVRVIVDSINDPAHTVIKNYVKAYDCADKIRISVLRTPRSGCSLKCSAMVQGLQELDRTHEIIAFMDADVVPHKTWIRELVTPLADTSIGVTFGNRWFLPADRSPGTAARAAWICCTDVVMQQMNLCWGGAMAARRTTLDALGVAGAWSHSFNDDILLGDLVRKAGLKTLFLPRLLSFNSSNCGSFQLVEFVRRQLIHTRLAHSLWPLIAVIGFCVSGVIPLAVMTLVLGGVVGNWTAAAWSAGTICGYLGLMSVYFRMVESVALSIAGERQEQATRLGIQTFIGIGIASVIHFVALISATFARAVSWRGIRYQFQRNGRVVMEAYQPYSP